MAEVPQWDLTRAHFHYSVVPLYQQDELGIFRLLLAGCLSINLKILLLSQAEDTDA